jgi:hypothetical protein
MPSAAAWRATGEGQLARCPDRRRRDRLEHCRSWHAGRPGRRRAAGHPRLAPPAGLGHRSALFRTAADRTGARGCRWLKIETQNVNAAACRFYYKMTTAPAPERKHHRAGAADRRHIAMTAIAEFRAVSSLASSASVYRAGRRAACLCITRSVEKARSCRDEGRPDHDGLLGHVRHVADPSNGLKPGWRGAWMQRTRPR